MSNGFDNIFNNFQSSSTSSFDFGDLLKSFTEKRDGQNTSNKNESGDFDDYDWKNAYESILNDFNSYRKRTESIKASEKKNLKKELLLGFLDVVDYLILTYSAKKKLNTYTEEDEMVLKKFMSFLKMNNVEPMKDMSGQPFDHNLHDAIMVDSSGMFDDDVITITLSQGYMIDGEVLRHAKVCISKCSD